MKKSILMILVLTMALSFAGCSKKNQGGETPEESPKQQSVKKPELAREDYPRVESSAETKVLSSAIASDLTGISPEEAQQLAVNGTNRSAMENLVAGKCDLIFVAQPSAEELKLAQDAGIELEVTPIAKEGLVFVTTTKNAIKSLTVRQIQGVYEGTIANWMNFGGQDVKLIAYQREKESISQSILVQSVMKDMAVKVPDKTFQSQQELLGLIAKDKSLGGMLGYMTYQEAKNLNEESGIKILEVDGVLPSPASIAGGQYAFTTAYCAVYKKADAANAASRKVAGWLAGTEGQQLVEKSGYVPFSAAQ